MVASEASLKRIARTAGLLYLLLGIAAAYGVMYVTRQTIVAGDRAATLKNLLDKEMLVRTGIIGHLISQVALVFLVLVLYRLLRRVNESRARLMVAFVVVQVPIVFLIEAFRLTSLLLVKGAVLPGLAPERSADTAMVLLQLHSHGIMLLEIFWGLWLIPFGMLAYRSDRFPRLLGILLVLAGTGYVLDSCTFILFPSFRAFTQMPALALSAIGEIAAILWLLIKGVQQDVAPGEGSQVSAP